MGKICLMAKQQNKELIYQCINHKTISDIANTYKDHKVAQHIEDLYKLILYQLQEIHNYRAGTIADIHRNAWKQYDEITLQKNTSRG